MHLYYCLCLFKPFSVLIEHETNQKRHLDVLRFDIFGHMNYTHSTEIEKNRKTDLYQILYFSKAEKYIVN